MPRLVSELTGDKLDPTSVFKKKETLDDVRARAYNQFGIGPLPGPPYPVHEAGALSPRPGPAPLARPVLQRSPSRATRRPTGEAGSVSSVETSATNLAAKADGRQAKGPLLVAFDGPVFFVPTINHMIRRAAGVSHEQPTYEEYVSWESWVTKRAHLLVKLLEVSADDTAERVRTTVREAFGLNYDDEFV